MAAVARVDIDTVKTAVVPVNVRGDRQAWAEIGKDRNNVVFRPYHKDFERLLGTAPTHSLLLSTVSSSRNPFFHGGCAYLKDHDELFLTSDLLQPSNSSQLPVILISRVSLSRNAQSAPRDDITTVQWQKLRPPGGLVMPAGAVAYQKGILFCSQGVSSPETGGIYYMPLGKPPVPLITSFGPRPFNSPSKLTVAADGAIWFTDSTAGFDAEIRKRPQLPNHVYRFDPVEGTLRVVADGLFCPSGLCFGPGEQTLYVCDIGAVDMKDQPELPSPSTIYAYDVMVRANQQVLANKRTFAFAMGGAPRDVCTDSESNVFAACGDGVEVWNAGGVPLGLIEVPDGCSTVCFGKAGEMFIGAREELWRVGFGRQDADTVMEA